MKHILIAVLLSALPGRVAAHSLSKQSDPASGAVLEQALTEISLTIADGVRLAAVRIGGSSGSACTKRVWNFADRAAGPDGRRRAKHSVAGHIPDMIAKTPIAEHGLIGSLNLEMLAAMAVLPDTSALSTYAGLP